MLKPCRGLATRCLGPCLPVRARRFRTQLHNKTVLLPRTTQNERKSDRRVQCDKLPHQALLPEESVATLLNHESVASNCRAGDLQAVIRFSSKSEPCAFTFVRNSG